MDFESSTNQKRRPDLRRVLKVCVLLAMCPMISGCYAGLAAIIVGLTIGLENSPPPELAPEIFLVGGPDSAAAGNSPDLIEVMFRVQNEDADTVSVAIEFEVIEWISGEPFASGERRPATPAEESSETRNLEPGTIASFLWDAKTDLGTTGASSACDANRNSAIVRLFLKPIEGELAGKEAVTPAFRASDTPPRLEILAARSQSSGNEAFLFVKITDLESDDVSLVVTVNDEPISPALTRNVFASSPEGVTDSFAYLASNLEVPPGAILSLDFSVSLREFGREVPCSFDSISIPFSNNDPPVIFLDNIPTEISSGIVPIKYQLFDRDENSVNVDIDVDLKDGAGFQPALEFPSSLSDGRTNLSTKLATVVSHSFLWDAGSQLTLQDNVTLRIKASDLQSFDDNRFFINIDTKSLFAAAPRANPAIDIPQPSSMQQGDFNGDGFLDLALIADGAISFLAGGSGGLSMTPRVTITLGPLPSAIVSVDLDGDGDQDLCVADAIRDEVYWLSGSSGQFPELETTIPVGERPISMHVAAIDPDSAPGVLVVCEVSGTLHWIRGGSIAPEAIEFSVGRVPKKTATGHFDGDCFLDIVTVSQFDGSLTFFPGGPDGPDISERQEILVGSAPLDLVSRDFEGDGFFDVAVLNNSSRSISYVRGGSSGMEPAKHFPLLTLPSSIPLTIFSVDWNNDSFVDLIVGGTGSTEITLFEGSSTGIVTSRLISMGPSPSSFIQVDGTLDDLPDLLVANSSSSILSLFRGTPSGYRSFGESIELSSGRPSFLEFGDFDSDGRPELIVSARNAGKLFVFRGETRSVVQQKAEIALSDVPELSVAPAVLAVSDFNGDGFSDLIVANQDSRELLLLQGNSTGLTLERAFTVPLREGPHAILLSHPSAGETPGIIVTSEGSSRVVFARFNDETGRLDAEETGALIGTFSPTDGDFRGDGTREIVVGNRRSSFITYFNPDCDEGTCHFGIGVASAMASGDFDQDGIDDLAVTTLANDIGQAARLYMFPGGRDVGLELSTRIEVNLAADIDHMTTGFFGGNNELSIALSTSSSLDLTVIRWDTFDQSLREIDRITLTDHPRTLISDDFNADGFHDLIVFGEGLTLTFLEGGFQGLGTNSDPSQFETSFVQAPISGDFNSDGFVDIAAADSTSTRVTFFWGSIDGPRFENRQEISVGENPVFLAAGDFNGDHTLDLAVANQESDSASIILTNDLVYHANTVFTLDSSFEGRWPISDPRSDPSYRLELSAGALAFGTPVCLTPTATRPVGERIAESRYCIVITDAVTMLRDKTPLEREGLLSLKIRTRWRRQTIDPARVRIYRWNDESDRAEWLQDSPVEIIPDKNRFAVDTKTCEERYWIRFPIDRYASYVAAYELEIP